MSLILESSFFRCINSQKIKLCAFAWTHLTANITSTHRLGGQGRYTEARCCACWCINKEWWSSSALGAWDHAWPSHPKSTCSCSSVAKRINGQCEPSKFWDSSRVASNSTVSAVVKATWLHQGMLSRAKEGWRCSVVLRRVLTLLCLIGPNIYIYICISIHRNCFWKKSKKEGLLFPNEKKKSKKKMELYKRLWSYFCLTVGVNRVRKHKDHMVQITPNNMHKRAHWLAH